MKIFTTEQYTKQSYTMPEPFTRTRSARQGDLEKIHLNSSVVPKFVIVLGDNYAGSDVHLWLLKNRSLLLGQWFILEAINVIAFEEYDDALLFMMSNV